MPARRARAPRRADLSQHFLRSRARASSLVRESSISRLDLVVEIGPGRGMLTEELARRSGEVLAVELDPGLCAELRRRFAGDARIRVVCADFLSFELPRDRPFKVFGNVPFNRTAAIVRRLSEAAHPPEDAYLVVQREAAARFSGSPYGPESLASLLLKPRWHVELGQELRREDFDPPPRVDAVLLWLARRGRPLVADDVLGAYRSFVAACFGRRGRTVARCLAGHLTRRQIQRLGRTLRFSPSAPPSALSFDQWLGLFRFHRRSGAGGRLSPRSSDTARRRPP